MKNLKRIKIELTSDIEFSARVHSPLLLSCRALVLFLSVSLVGEIGGFLGLLECFSGVDDLEILVNAEERLSEIGDDTTDGLSMIRRLSGVGDFRCCLSGVASLEFRSRLDLRTRKGGDDVLLFLCLLLYFSLLEFLLKQPRNVFD